MKFMPKWCQLKRKRTKTVITFVFLFIFMMLAITIWVNHTEKPDGEVEKKITSHRLRMIDKYSIITKDKKIDMLKMEITFRQLYLSVKVGESLKYDEKYMSSLLLLRVVVVDGNSGEINNYRRFNIDLNVDIDQTIKEYIDAVYLGHIVILAIFNPSLKVQLSVVDYIAKLGSKQIKEINNLQNWIFCFRKTDQADTTKAEYEEATSKTGFQLQMLFSFTPVEIVTPVCHTWPDSQFAQREKFCKNHFSYQQYCRCDNSFPIVPTGDRILRSHDNMIKDVPIVIISSDRPQYLVRVIENLMKVHGLRKKNILIDMDEKHPEILGLAKLFDIRTDIKLAKCTPTCRVSQHYRDSLVDIFSKKKHAEDVIIFEDDLIMSPDILSFFAQLIPQMHQDPSIYCISAWNDQGYSHSIGDASMVYRVQSMPGLGWVLNRKIFNEIITKWPYMVNMHWDMWMRLEHIILDRECLIPDISRTFHIGKYGLNIDPMTQIKHFDTRFILNHPYVKIASNIALVDKYEELMNKLVNEAQLVPDSQKICDIAKSVGKSEIIFSELNVEDLINKTRIVYVTMKHRTDDVAWKSLFTCLNMWNRDLRGIHKGAVRIWFNNVHYVMLGYPYSPYSTNKPLSATVFEIK